MEFHEIIELDDCQRTADVKSRANFETLMISPNVVDALRKGGFKNPSPVQEKAIPAGIMGLDILVQAKSGTGKTLVFSVMTVENLKLHVLQPQRLIVTPTREIAAQIKETVKKIAPPGTKIVVLVGGNPVRGDLQILSKGAHIIIGTTGRLCQLVQNQHLSLSHCDLFVLDEADKLMDSDFQKDINYLFSSLPSSRQVAVFSATYPRDLVSTLSKFMKDVTLIRLNSGEVQLIGIKQYAYINYRRSSECVVELLQSVNYKQAIVFCNSHLACEPLQRFLEEHEISCAFISAQLEQSVRDKTIDLLKQNKIKVLVSTDLIARGIDAIDVNLVVNMEPAVDCETYFHRIGRAARFGGFGAAVTLLTSRKSVSAFSRIVEQGGITARTLTMGTIPFDLTVNEDYFDKCAEFQSDSDQGTYTPLKSLRVADLPTNECTFPQFKNEDGRSYSKEELIVLKSKGIPSSRLTSTINILGLNSSGFGQFLSNYVASRSSSKVTEIACVEDSSTQKKYKFVPSRSKSTKKFYLRGELLSIRNSVSEQIWKEYASKKWDLTKEPFLETSTEVATVLPPTPVEVKSSTNDRISTVVHKYTRKQMIGIQTKIPKESWMPYIKAKWNTNEEPWQLDSYLRCPFEEQLRRTRIRDKQLREKVLTERKTALITAPKLVSSSRSISKCHVDKESFMEFCSDLKAQYDCFNEESSSTNGPVVPLRDDPDTWRYRVNFYSNFVENSTLEFQHRAKVSGKMICEQGTQTTEMSLCRSLKDLGPVETEDPNRLQEPSRSDVGMIYKNESNGDVSSYIQKIQPTFDVLDTYLLLASKYYE